MDAHDPNAHRDWMAWKTAVGDPRPGGSCPTDLDLAAFLDGRLDDVARDDLEAHLAACEACRATMIELREDLAAEIEPISPSLVQRLRDLVPASPVIHTIRSQTHPFARWASAAAAAVLISVIGYRTGTGVVAPPTEGVEQAGADSAYDLFDVTLPDEFDLLNLQSEDLT